MTRALKRGHQKIAKSDNSVRKTVKISYKNNYPVWKFDLADFSHQTWNVNSVELDTKDILKSLKSFEGMTWQEIDSQSGGKSFGTNHHYINISDMVKEAQKRAKELI